MAEPQWFRSSHENGKWHLTNRVASDGEGVRVFIARCGTMIGVDSAQSHVMFREHAPEVEVTCSKCIRKGR